MWEGEDGGLLNLIHGRVRAQGVESVKVESIGASAFFLQTITVAPNRFRPANKVGEQNYVHQQTVDMKRIILLNNEVKKLKGDKLKGDKIFPVWVELQDAVNSYIDPSRSLRQKDKTGLK